MMQLLGLMGLTAFVAASGIVGARILLLARRTRGLPETLMGLSLVVAGCLGTGLAVVPLIWTNLAPNLVHATNQVANVANHVGYTLLGLFVWRVFRPGDGWARALFFATAGGLFVTGAGVAFTLELGESISRPTGPARLWILASLAARLVIYVWAATESFRYYGKLTRRMKLGLADAQTANRFFYWGVCMSAVVGIFLNLGIEIWFIGALQYADVSRVISAILGFVVAGSVSLAFFPGKGASEAVASEVPRRDG